MRAACWRISVEQVANAENWSVAGQLVTASLAAKSPASNSEKKASLSSGRELKNATHVTPPPLRSIRVAVRQITARSVCVDGGASA
jgi:hypothetical protein